MISKLRYLLFCCTFLLILFTFSNLYWILWWKSTSLLNLFRKISFICFFYSGSTVVAVAFFLTWVLDSSRSIGWFEELSLSRIVSSLWMASESFESPLKFLYSFGIKDSTSIEFMLFPKFFSLSFFGFSSTCSGVFLVAFCWGGASSIGSSFYLKVGMMVLNWSRVTTPMSKSFIKLSAVVQVSFTSWLK